jgi:cobalamin biosynthesis protein CbiD
MQKFLQFGLIVGTGAAASSSAAAAADAEKSIVGNVQLEQVGGSSSSTAPVDGISDDGIVRRLRNGHTI